MQAQAFAPANGSLIFETYEATEAHGSGSLGVGFTLDSGVVATVVPAERTTIVVKNEVWEFPTVAQVVSALATPPVRVNLAADLPFGCGFGMSGASALSTAYALGALFSLGRSPEELALVAHQAEIDNATGRGDVGGQFNGGFMVKTKKGAPLEVETLPIPEQTVYCRIFGPISTRDVLRDIPTMQRVNQAGRAALRQLSTLPDLDLETLLYLSRTFAEESGLLRSPRVRRAIADAELAGGHASMVMLGEAVVSSVPIPGCRAYPVVKNPASVLGMLV
ncbi:MAG: pantoate kinase [Verrucomicrobiales bacterium]